MIIYSISMSNSNTRMNRKEQQRQENENGKKNSCKDTSSYKLAKLHKQRHGKLEWKPESLNWSRK